MGAEDVQTISVPSEKEDVEMTNKESSSPTTTLTATNTESTEKKITQPLKKGSFKDSVLVYIPMSVTADLGIAMRRTRQKRLAKLRKLYPALMESLETTNKAQETTDSIPDPSSNDKNGDENLEEKNTLPTSMTTPSTSTTQDTKGTKAAEKNDNVPRREQYASVLDYLEAKYVRGVMLDDIDEKIQKKKELKKQQRQEKKLLMKKKKRKKKLLMLKKKKMREQKGEKGEGQAEKEGDGEDEDRSLGSLSSQGSNLDDIDDADLDMSDDDLSDEDEDLDEDDDDILSESDDGTGSCYSDASGFLDDSLLRTSVAEQVMASSFYGATRLQAESKKSSKKSDNEGEEEENLDDGFFVNVGALEMADGFDDTDAADIDFDFLDTLKNPKKKSKSKKTKDQTNSKDKTKGSKTDSGSNTKKSSTSDKKKSKGNSNSKDKSNSKSTNQDKMSGYDEPISSLKKKRKNPSSSGGKNAASNKKKIKKISLSSSSKKPNKSSNNSVSSNSSNDDSDIKNKKNEQQKKKDSSEEITLSPEVQKIRDTCNVLKKEMKRLYQKVVKEIKKMPPENFPRKKKRKKETIKVSITIPQNKKPGDEIQFQNPRVPGQRLKVQVPENGVPGKSFVVSVPAPSKPTPSQNSNDGNVFSRDAKEILDQYSRAYDDWIEMEAKYNEVAPDGNRKYKPNNERMKKFDKLLSIFPKDLLEPIDAAYLRKIVRRSRQNRSKRLKNQQLQQSLTSSPSKEATKTSSENVHLDLTNNSRNYGVDGDDKKNEVEKSSKNSSNTKKSHINQEFFVLNIPRKGTEFPSITFDPIDFTHKS